MKVVFINKVQDNIVTIINNYFEKLMMTRNIPQYFEGYVISVNGDFCSIKMNDQIITLPKRENLNISNGNIVLICSPTGKLTDGFVDLKKL